MGTRAMRWVFLCTILVAGCTQLIHSGAIGEGQKGASCADDGVAYHLPRRKVEITVQLLTKATKATPTDAQPVLTPYRYTLTVSKELIPAGHLDAHYCLHYKSSAFSTDQIGVEVSKEGLLRKIYSDAKDQTKEITLKLVQGVADLVASERADLGRIKKKGAENDVVQHIATYIVDPFDQAAMEAMNAALWSYGYCVHLDDSDDLYVPNWAAAQCQHGATLPVQPSAIRGPVTPEPSEALQKTPWGVLYRPNLTHRLMVRYRPDPQDNTPWVLDQAHVLEMPNAAPTFSVDVRRAFFANRQTVLSFDHGVLSDAAITKSSELNALADIPLQVAQFIVSIPAQVLKLQINRRSNANEVIQANQQLLETYRQVTKKQEEQAQLNHDEQTCRTEAEKERILPKSVSDGLRACITELERCRAEKPLPKTDEKCANDYWKAVQDKG